MAEDKNKNKVQCPLCKIYRANAFIIKEKERNNTITLFIKKLHNEFYLNKTYSDVEIFKIISLIEKEMKK
jgi:hypothetical protein